MSLFLPYSLLPIFMSDPIRLFAKRMESDDGKIDLALATDPGSPNDLRDRGMVYLAMNRHREAVADFKAYLSLSPAADPQAQEVHQVLQRIRSMMN